MEAKASKRRLSITHPLTSSLQQTEPLNRSAKIMTNKEEHKLQILSKTNNQQHRYEGDVSNGIGSKSISEVHRNMNLSQNSTYYDPNRRNSMFYLPSTSTTNQQRTMSTGNVPGNFLKFIPFRSILVFI